MFSIDVIFKDVLITSINALFPFKLTTCRHGQPPCFCIILELKIPYLNFVYFNDDSVGTRDFSFERMG